MTQSLLRAAATAALALGLAVPAVAAVQAPSAAAELHRAIHAIATHHPADARGLIAAATAGLATQNPAAPAVQTLRYARQDLMAGHGNRAMQDLYAALPLVHSAG